MKEFKFKISGQDYSATVAEENAGSLVVTVNGQAYQVEVPQTKAAAPVMARGNAGAAQAGGPKNINSELPGTVTKIVAANGQRVKKGDVLLVIEAMKMANDIVSDVEGTVQRIAVTEGQSVNQGDLLVEMVADAVAAPAAAAAPAPKAAPAPAAGEGKEVLSPLEGKFYMIKNASDTPVKVGDEVKEGDVLCYVEAMKTYNAVRAEFAGKITSICFHSGDAVSEDDVLMTIQ